MFDLLPCLECPCDTDLQIDMTDDGQLLLFGLSDDRIVDRARDVGRQHVYAGYVQPELNVAMLLKDGDSLQWWTDFPRTKASFARVSEKDAREAMRLASHKLSVKTRFVKRFEAEVSA